MGTAVDELVALLDLEQLEVNLFRGVTQVTDRERVFGGQVLAQGLMAAGRTVEEARPVHSMHAYFLRHGDPELPIVFEVDRIRDGRSFTTRRAVAIQRGEAIFNLAASFQVEEPGPDHSDPMPDVPLPDDAGSSVHWHHPKDRPVDQPGAYAIDALELRPVGGVLPTPLSWGDATPRDPDQDIWVRVRGRLPDDPLLHACALAYASDLTLLTTALLPHRTPFDGAGFMMASLDHVMWFHRPCRADEWLLYRTHSPSAAFARGFSQGSMFREDGVLGVTLAQEGLFRPLR
ncbi:MAG TPA: acyl-CoA thioesterase II [Acidimicrobiia bacterium]